MVKVYAPNEQYTGVSASVPFVNGVGETDNPHLLRWFENHGYTVECSEPEEKSEKEPEGDNDKPAEPPVEQPGKEQETPEYEKPPGKKTKGDK